MQEYELLWECFMSDQMSAKQLDQHIREDPEFEKWLREKLDLVKAEENK